MSHRTPPEPGPLTSHPDDEGRLRRGGRRVRGWVAAAPGTYVWLLVLTVSALQFQQVPPRVRHVILHVDSTNLFQLAHHPLHVLVLSAVWTQASTLLTYVVLFQLFHVPAERWLGTARWLAVVVTAHVGATFVSEGTVWLAIRYGVDPTRMQYTLDVGVSYGLAGVAGVLAYRLVSPWREVYVIVALCYLGTRVVVLHTFTDIGHLSAYLIGLCCHPLTRGRPRWDPRAALAQARQRTGKGAGAGKRPR
ncbi:rhomboid-like protein [Streptantibioticus parmotrematis]|uniref:rhomboid-like protein n=1 Tax=Streptantibioticus parmotrematis TaxID=2873249 RepID=UPI00207C0E53|nr:rhomboid-like protein [Streptantibioticus parmotrematis]